MTEARVAPIKRALISVSDKTGVVPFAQRIGGSRRSNTLTGGTCRLLMSEVYPLPRCLITQVSPK